MRFTRLLPWFLLLAASLAGAETNIAVLDQNDALFRSEAARMETEKLKQTYGEDEVRIRTLESSINELRSRLETDAVILDDAEKTEIQQQIQEQLTERTSLVEKLQQIQQQRRTQFVRQYRPLLAQAIRSVVDEKEIDLVVESSSVIFAAETMDITADVLERFNSLLAEASAGAN